MAEQPTDDLELQAAACADARERVAQIVNPRIERGRGELCPRLLCEAQDLLDRWRALESLLEISHEGGDLGVLRIAPKRNRGRIGHG